jgi:transmembrane sensor
VKSENEIVVNDELMVRYLCGEATPEEAIALMEWLKEGDHASRFKEVEETWYVVHRSKAPRIVDSNKALNRISPILNVQTPDSKTRFFNPASLVFRIAAMLLVAVTVGLMLYLGFDKRAEENVELSTLANSDDLKLPDSSSVTLYHHTRLSYPKNFDKNLRAVEMHSGEAFFAITSDAQRPFIIQTPLASIRVVGTSFNVTVTNNQLQVGVREGKVMIYTQKDTTLIETGFTGSVRTGVESIVTENSVNANAWAYSTKRFVFRGTPMSDVLQAIEKAYGFTIEVSDSAINKCKLNATFDHVSIENMLNLVAETLNLSVTRDGTKFILEGEGCH